jgi:hypothetical protein
MRKLLLPGIALLIAGSALFAAGSKETIDTPARNLESWSETVDISKQKPGKYNILVTGTDLAGNEAYGGPFNMYVDPKSDLPVARITNPLMSMRVPGNLNVVGTCIDDDAVAYVELFFDGSETPVKAQGADFWSYYLDTKTLSEGKHTIAVVGVDVNGVRGEPFKVTWNLDRNRPETSVDNLALGALVSGKFSLEGKVSDGNGIKSLAYSLDGGVNFMPLELKHGKNDPYWTWNLTIDTLGSKGGKEGKGDKGKKEAKEASVTKDGPAVCWFKATDGQGSEGIFTFLYFVDNSAPQINFIYPAPEEAVNGVFSVAGTARDAIGIQSLSWTVGKETGSFDLVAGNPYWVKEFDVRGQDIKSFDIQITAIDKVGNKTTAIRKIPVDPRADLPLVTIAAPAANAVVDGKVRFSGLASDDDGVAEIHYRVDGGPERTVATQGAFGVEIADLIAGQHAVEAWAVDSGSIRGPSVTVPFVVAGAPPAIAIEPVKDELSEINPEAGASVAVSVVSAAGLKELSWGVTGMPDSAIAIKPGVPSAGFSIPISAAWPYGLLTIEVRAVDIHDRKTVQTMPIYVTNLGIPRDTPPSFSDATLAASREVTIPASGKTPAGTGTASVSLGSLVSAGTPFKNGMLVTLAGPGAGKTAQKDDGITLAIESPIPVTAVAWSLNDGAALKVAAQKSGATSYAATIPLKYDLPADWTTVRATVTLKDLSTLEVSGVICVVRPAPSSGTFDDEQFAWGGASRNDKGNILLFDGGAASGLYNGKPDRRAASVGFAKGTDAKATAGLSVSLSGNAVTVTGKKDGEYAGVSLSIVDSSGATFKTAPVTFIVDSALPVLDVATTERPYWIQNSIPAKGSASDDNGIASIDYSLDGGISWKAIKGASFDQKIDVAEIPDGKLEFLVRATDKTGRVATDWRVFAKDTAAPTYETVLPAPADVVNGETLMAFRLADSGAVALAEYRAPGDRSAKDKTPWVPVPLSSLTNVFVGKTDMPIADKMEFRFTDAAGNAVSTLASPWRFTIDAKADLPVVEIHLPSDNEIVRKDFVVSGVVYDDDGVSKIWYKIDAGKYVELPIEHSFSIPIPLLSLTDNEHVITVYAEDIHGVRGPEVTRKVRVSLEEPKAEVRAPLFDVTSKGVITVTGVASDKNGIEKVELSLDNGNSFDLAEGTTDWSYRFDTRVIQDGTHVVFVRVYDKYETVGLYSSLINIDNTAPAIRLEFPLDGTRISDTLFISGQTMDNIGLSRVTAKISNIEPKQPAIPASLGDIPFANELIISRGLDIKSLPEGFYNMEIRGYDAAGNVTRVSRNFEVFRGKDRNRIEFLYPLNGEKAQGVFNVYGRVVSEDPVSSLMMYVDGKDVGATTLSPTGYFKFTLGPDKIADGTHKLSVRALVAGEKVIVSEEHSIIYKSDGPWVAIDNLAMGDFAIDRPWLMGTTGYSLTEEDILALKAKDTPKEKRRELLLKSVNRVEISFDNGKTFHETESGKKWRYRIETGDIAEGYHFLVVRAIMNSGEVAVTRSILQVDKTKPTIRMISPGEGGRYNDKLVFSGLSSDDVELKSVMLSLRPGDKSAYAVPAFIQGLYFDWHFWGATLYDIGIGLTFFDDNVKIQGQYGQFTDSQRAVFTPSSMRYGGNVYGVKMLANIAYVPLEYFFGPDFYWLSATAALGANFSYFTESQSGKGQILSAALVQMEFPRVTLPKRKYFSTFAFYTEAQFWFIPTDVDSTEVNIQSILPHVTAGVRVNVF